MKTEYFLVADAVEFYEGKSVIVGTFDRFVADSFPYMCPRFGVAVGIRLDGRDRRTVYRFRLELYKRGSRKVIGGLPVDYVCDTTKTRYPKKWALSARFPPTRFDSPGKYYLRLVHADKERTISQIEIEVVRRSKTRKKKAKK